MQQQKPHAPFKYFDPTSFQVINAIQLYYSRSHMLVVNDGEN